MCSLGTLRKKRWSRQAKSHSLQVLRLHCHFIRPSLARLFADGDLAIPSFHSSHRLLLLHKESSSPGPGLHPRSAPSGSDVVHGDDNASARTALPQQTSYSGRPEPHFAKCNRTRNLTFRSMQCRLTNVKGEPFKLQPSNQILPRSLSGEQRALVVEWS